MRHFTRLFTELDRTKRSGEKLAALERYFRAAPPADAAWALHFLAGRRIKRLAPRNVLRGLIEEATGLPSWLVSEAYESVGDLAETFALLLPDPPQEADRLDLPLHRLVEDRMLPMRTMDDQSQRRIIVETWRELDAEGRFVFNKLITGNFRVGVAQTMIVKALAAAADVSVAVMAQRFSGNWEPSAASFTALMTGAGGAGGPQDQPYPFFLGYPLETPVAELGEPSGWIGEWKYDGIRAQVIRRVGRVMIWSRGEEVITGAFPEVAAAAAALPVDSVLDGEILAWEDDRPLPFATLQRRINRVQVEPSLFPDVPVRFIAFDLLEIEGSDWRERPLRERRERLRALAWSLPQPADIAVSPEVPFRTWDELASLRESVRDRGVEGLMLKRADGTYGIGRRRGDWWKWKIDPLLLDAVLINAQAGSGRRSGLFTDYTFGVWSGDGPDRELVPVAKAYSGLTDAEIKDVDRFIRNNTLERRGPIRIVKPELVFELAFQGVQESTRHKAGLAVRFPRMNRWRKDKTARDADTIETLRAMGGL